MSIPSKQIGWSQESNLLWQIARQLEGLTGVTSKISSGGESVTKSQVDALIASNSLVPGKTYIISGVDVPLYGGTTIMLQAATTNELELAGHGVFYNPKYQNSQLTPNNGYGVWSNYISLTMSSIVGTFTNGDTVTANNGATATYLAKGFLLWISGNWSAATSISNGSGATANVTGGVSPSYVIGQDVIWGGKHWTNISGAVGTATNKYTLSADWSAVSFNSTDYNVVADIIHYDYIHDMIIRRKDKWDNDVDGNFEVFTEFASPDGYDYGNPIKDFQWGNGPEDFNTVDYQYIGVQSNYVKDSYFECINFIGYYIWKIKLTQMSYLYNNITDNFSYFESVTLNNYSYIDNNTLTDGGNIYNNTLTNSAISYNTLINSGNYNNAFTNSNISYSTFDNSNISYNTFTRNSYIQNSILTNGSINGNILTNSSINNNALTSISFIIDNTLTNSAINNNTLTNSYIQNNTLTDSAIYNNTLTSNSAINYNTLTGTSNINSNILTSSVINGNTLINDSGIDSNTLTSYSEININTLSIISNINNNTLTNSNVNNNTLINSLFNFSTSGTLTSKVIRYVVAEYATGGFNISAATIIYGFYSKQMFKNSAGTTRLGYYNASDVFTVVNVNA